MKQFLLFPLLLLISSAASAELTDLRASANGSMGQLWIGFDGQPQTLAVEQTAQGAVLVVTGVEAADRRISPAHTELVRSVRLAQGPGALRVELDASRVWTDLQAEIRQGGVLVTIAVDAGQPMSPSSAHSPQAPQPDTHTAPAEPAVAPDAGGNAAEDTPAVVADHTPVETPETQPEPAPEPAAAPTAAITECERLAQAVADDPWNERLLLPHAACLAEGGQAREAAGIYSQILAFEPENYAAAVALADIRADEGDTSAARQLYQQAARNARSDVQAAAALQRARQLDGGQR